METRAVARFVRVSPRKARAVIDLIRGESLDEARKILEYSPRAAARIVSKVLKSAAANAENNNKMNPDNLYVASAFVDEGPTLKRYRPRAMGRATRINKRTSHITVVLDERFVAEKKRRVLRRGKEKSVYRGVENEGKGSKSEGDSSKKMETLKEDKQEREEVKEKSPKKATAATKKKTSASGRDQSTEKGNFKE